MTLHYNAKGMDCSCSLSCFYPSITGPPSFSVSGSEFQLLEGTSVTLPCNQTSVPEADIIWSRLLLDQDSNESQTITLNDNFSVGPANELVIREVEFDDSGYYTCTANNRYGNEEIEYLLAVTGESQVWRHLFRPVCTSALK